MDMGTWSDVFADTAGRVIRESAIGPWFVSTLWLGVDQQGRYSSGPPLIFETVVFLGDQPARLGGHWLQWRWTYERQARIGHRHIAAFIAAVVKRDGAVSHPEKGACDASALPG